MPLVQSGALQQLQRALMVAIKMDMMTDNQFMKKKSHAHVICLMNVKTVKVFLFTFGKQTSFINEFFISVSVVGGRMLCLDGGGIRGLNLIKMLEALELYLGGPVIEYFDWIAGTSTAGILALALASGIRLITHFKQQLNYDSIFLFLKRQKY